MFYRLSDLKRYNNQPRIKSESLAEHQYYCTLILIMLRRELFGLTDAQYTALLEYSMVHDIGELYTGDMPHDIKQEFPEFKVMLDKAEDNFYKEIGMSYIVNGVKANKILKLIFKLADTMQVMQYAKNEQVLGNKSKEMQQIVNVSKFETNLFVKELKSLGVLSDSFTIDRIMELL